MMQQVQNEDDATALAQFNDAEDKLSASAAIAANAGHIYNEEDCGDDEDNSLKHPARYMKV